MNCKICGSNVEEIEWNKGFGKLYICDKCGRYIVESSAENLFEKKWVRNALYYYIRQLTNKKSTLMLSAASSDTKEYNVITEEDLENIYPKNFHERIDWILLNLVHEDSNLGKQFALNSNIKKWSAIFAIDDEKLGFQEQQKGIIEVLADMNYLKIMGSHSVITIAHNGWERIDKLQSDKSKSKKVFIAMWFDERMSEERKKIKKAIHDSGYIPIIIDEKEHNNQIVPEILYEIDTCEFMIADLTGGRNGVYYEAGYGLGKGKNVILTLKEGVNDIPHFDVSQTNQVRYKNSDELYNRLIKRIEATIN